MKLVKSTDQKQAVLESKIENFKTWNGARMVTITGSHKPLILSQKKATAIIRLIPALKEFAEGKYDSIIDSCGEGEIVRPTAE